MADSDSLSDAELVAAARAGNTEAFACLADRHRGMIAALARRLLGTDDLVADLTQEATVAALVSLGHLRSPSQFGAWYAGIALNVARRLLREVSARSLPEDYPDVEPGPAERAEAAEAARRVREAVATLAPGQRAAVLAFYWQGLTSCRVRTRTRDYRRGRQGPAAPGSRRAGPATCIMHRTREGGTSHVGCS